MPTSRRSFMWSILALSVPPAFVKNGFGILMPVSSAGLVERIYLPFTSGTRTMLRGDTLRTTTILKEGTRILCDFAVNAPCQSGGSTLYLDKGMPKAIPDSFHGNMVLTSISYENLEKYRNA